MTNRFGRKIKISEGISYDCVKCSKRWHLNSWMKINGKATLIYNPNQRTYRRKPTHCSCGTAFDFPTIHISELKDRYGNHFKRMKEIKYLGQQ
jgi:hypothetical protein